jgi:signal transduction histidine kinase
MPYQARRIEDFGLVTAALVMCAVAAGITLANSPSEYAWLEALARASMVGVPMAVGFYASRRPPFERFGRLLIAAGAVWFLTVLSESESSLLYSIGRVAGWCVEPLVIYLMLAFPWGRLTTRLDRVLVVSITLVAALLYLPTALVVETYPVPAPWGVCDGACPSNALMVAGSEPAVVDDVIRPLRELLTIVLFVAVTARLAWRIHASTRLMRRVLGPVLAVAVFRCAAFGTTVAARRIDAESTGVDVGAWLIALGLPLLACGFLVGLARWRLFIAAAMQQLARRLRGHPEPEDLRLALAEAFDDPGLEVAYWIGDEEGHWADAAGLPVAVPTPESGRTLTEVRDGDRRVAAILHDIALRDDAAFIDTATAYAIMTLDNHRLSAQTASLVREVRESRLRIQSSADEERRRIEHDLHDGAQQRLVALRIKLELAAERMGDPAGADALLLRGLGTEVEEALDDVRSLARGIYPAALADRGLVEALRSAAFQSPLPATVLAAGVRRYPREIETAAYFCCLEALQNAAKHARDATAVVIDLSDDGSLRFEVSDDGAGFDERQTRPGMGLTTMRDRLGAVGGEVSVRSRPGHGTRVTASIPLPVAAPSVWSVP